MQAGRPKRSTKSDFAKRLAGLREAAGLSQRQMAARLDISQAAYALWEKRNVALQASRMVQLAEILGVGVEDLLGTGRKATRRGGPEGRARRSFEAVSRLPQNQQKKILDVVDALVAQSNATK